jgi:hypothetical protein
LVLLLTVFLGGGCGGRLEFSLVLSSCNGADGDTGDAEGGLGFSVVSVEFMVPKTRASIASVLIFMIPVERLEVLYVVPPRQSGIASPTRLHTTIRTMRKG